VRADDEQRHRREPDPTAEGRAQQDEETDDGEGGHGDGDQQDRVAGDARETETLGDGRQWAGRLPVRGQQRLVGRARRRAHERHREQTGRRQCERAPPFLGGATFLLASSHG